MNIRQVLERYHIALDEFSRGNSQPVKMIVSHRDDVTLANPFGPAVRGWRLVSEALEFASSRFRDGKVTSIETIAQFETPELVTIFEIEQWKARVSGRENIDSFTLRVTSTFRPEENTWKLVHRHADPIATFNPDGPLRRSAG